MKVTASPKPLLRPTNIDKRLAFAHREIESYHLDNSRFDRILWSDETSASCYPKSTKISVWVHSSVSKAERPKNLTLKNGGFSVVLRLFFGYRLGPLFEVQGTINGAKYLKLVQDVVKPELDAAAALELYLTLRKTMRPFISTCKLVREYLTQQGISTLDWPPQSPDINPIENVWAIIKQELYSQKTFPSGRNDLIDRVFEIWQNFGIELRQNLSDSVKSRLYAVVKAGGNFNVTRTVSSIVAKD